MPSINEIGFKEVPLEFLTGVSEKWVPLTTTITNLPCSLYSNHPFIPLQGCCNDTNTIANKSSSVFAHLHPLFLRQGRQRGNDNADNNKQWQQWQQSDKQVVNYLIPLNTIISLMRGQGGRKWILQWTRPPPDCGRWGWRRQWWCATCSVGWGRRKNFRCHVLPPQQQQCWHHIGRDKDNNTIDGSKGFVHQSINKQCGWIRGRWWWWHQATRTDAGEEEHDDNDREPTSAYDAILATIVASRQAQIWLNIEVDISILISTLILWIQKNPLLATLDNTCARLPAS